MRTDPRDAAGAARLALGLVALGSASLLASLFMTWSHQSSPAARLEFRPLGALAGVPVNASAWQVYTTADVLLALLAAGLVAVTLWGGTAWRLVTALTAAGALAFTIHALAVPPTDGVLLVKPVAGSGAASGAGGRTSGAAVGYAATAARSGPGEAVAVAGLVAALAGLLMSVGQRPAPPGRRPAPSGRSWRGAVDLSGARAPLTSTAHASRAAD